MNKQQVMGFVRHLLTFGGGWIVGMGVLDEATMMEVVGAVTTLVGVAWSMFAPEKKTA